MINFIIRFSSIILLISGLIIILGCLSSFYDATAIESLAKIISSVKGHSDNYQVELWYIDKLNYILRALLFSGVLIFISGLTLGMREKFIKLIQTVFNPLTVEQLNRAILKYGSFNLALTAYALLLGIYLRIDWFLVPRSFWNDSYCLALAVMRVPWKEISGLLPFGQQAPPGFIIVSKSLGELFCYNEYALLFVPFAAGIASSILFLLISVKLLHPRVVFIATFLWALNPELIFYAGEFKQYSTDIFFSLFLLLLTLRVIESSFKSGLPVLAIAGIIAMVFSHPAIFVIAGCCSILIITIFTYHGNDQRQAAAKVAAMIFMWIATFCLIYFLHTAKSTHPSMYLYHADGFIRLDSFYNFANWISETFRNAFVFPIGLAPRWAPFLWPLGASLMIAGIVTGCKRNRAITCGGITMLFLLLLASALEKYPVRTGDSALTPRLILFTVPFFLIWISEGTYGWFSLLRLKNYSAACIGLLLSGIMFVSWATTFYIRQEVRPLINIYKKEKRTDDIIWIYPGAITAFEYNTRSSPLPYVTGLVVNGGGSVPVNSMYDSLKPLLNRTGRIWLLFSQYYEYESQKVCTFISNSGCKKVSEIQTVGAILVCYEISGK